MHHAFAAMNMSNYPQACQLQHEFEVASAVHIFVQELEFPLGMMCELQQIVTIKCPPSENLEKRHSAETARISTLLLVRFGAELREK